MAPFILHEDPISANCYKIRLTAALLDMPLERCQYNILKGDTRTPYFLNNVSKFGRIPVLEIDADTFLPQSNAACYYLADINPSSPLIPSDPLLRAEMLRWMFFEQNHHEVSIATLRFWFTYIGREELDSGRRAQIDGKIQQGRAALNEMDQHLAKSTNGWLVGNSITLADICLFAYTHVAYDAGFDLAEWPSVERWCGKVTFVDRFVPM